MLITVDEACHGPRLELLDATDGALDEFGLRQLARAWPPALRAARVSRSHSFPYALVGWHTDRIGVDIERVVACDEQFGRSICTPAEAARAPWHSDEEIISLWSSKEAPAKALGDALGYDPRRLESPTSWAHGGAGPWRARSLRVADGYCAWACWRSALTDR